MIQNGSSVGITKSDDYIIVDNKKYLNNNEEEKQLYVLLNKNTPYKFNIRLKPWVTAHGRNLLGETALTVGLEHIIRVHTDNLCLDQPFDFKDDNFICEKKTSGLIKWSNVNSYEKVKENI